MCVNRACTTAARGRAGEPEAGDDPLPGADGDGEEEEPHDASQMVQSASVLEVGWWVGGEATNGHSAHGWLPSELP